MAVVGGASHYDLPPGDELSWRNRRIIAERMRWPAGALEACEEIERTHPGWSPSWHDANIYPGFEAPAGYYALRLERNRGEGPAYGVDAAALTAAIEAVFSRCPTCGLRYPVPPDSDIPLHEAPGTGRRCDVHWSRRTVEAEPGSCVA